MQGQVPGLAKMPGRPGDAVRGVGVGPGGCGAWLVRGGVAACWGLAVMDGACRGQ